MFYKRISKGIGQYALFPENVDIDQIIELNGANSDYYDSIYLYKKEHYESFVSGLKKYCSIFKIKFDENNLLKTNSRLRKKIAKLKKEAEEKEDEEEVERYNQIKSEFSVAGTDDIKTRRLVFDFDSEENIEEARHDTLKLIDYFKKENIPEEAIQICFSGKKGFSVELTLTQFFSKNEFVNIVTNLTKNLKSFDPKIKDHQRLFRIPLTKHHGTKLYKIPLTYNQLKTLTIEQIKNNAKSIIDEHYQLLNNWQTIRLPEKIYNLKFKSIDNEKEQKETSLYFEDKLDLTKKPSWLEETKYALQEGFFQKGNRNTAFMILCSTYKKQGFSKELTFSLLKTVAKIQAKRETKRLGKKIKPYSDEKLLNEVVNYVYSPNWNGGIYTDKTNELLQQTAKSLGLRLKGDPKNKRLKIEDLEKRWLAWSRNYNKNIIKTGLKSLDKKVTITTGMVVGLLGSAGSGKTSFSLNFLESVSKTGNISLFYSLDTYSEILYNKLVQRETGIYDPARMRDLNKYEKEIQEGTQRVKELLKNVEVVEEGGSTVDDIEKQVELMKQEYGDNFKLLVVDYLESIYGQAKVDPNTNYSLIIQRLRDMAAKYSIAVLVVLQPNKAAGDVRNELTSVLNIKGTSKIYEQCSLILTMWRPGFNPQDSSNDKYASICIVKNRVGDMVGQFDYRWEGLRGKLYELNSIEKLELEKIVDKNKQDKIDDLL